jgi:hypothetical protein
MLRLIALMDDIGWHHIIWRHVGTHSVFRRP